MATAHDTTATTPHGPRPPALAFALVALLIDVLGIGFIIPVLPGLVRSLGGGDFSAGSRWFGAFASVFAVMQFLFQPLFGRLSDAYGRRPVILLSLAGTGLDYALMALAPSLPWLFLGRVLSGITASSVTAVTAYVADVTPPERRAQSFGYIGAVFGVGFIIGPGIGGLLATLGPRAPFWGAAALALLNALYGVFVLPESNPPERRTPVTLAAANPFATLRNLGRYPLVLALSASYVCVRLAESSLQTTWVLYSTYRFHWAEWQNALSLSAFGVMNVIVQGVIVRRLVPRLGEPRAVIVGLSLGAVAYALYGTVTVGWMMYVIIAAGALGGIAMPALQAIVSRTVDPREQGAVQGGLGSLMSLAAIFAPLIATNLFGYFVSSAAPVQIPGVSFYFGALLMLAAMFFARRAFRLVPVPGVAHSGEGDAPAARG